MVVSKHSNDEVLKFFSIYSSLIKISRVKAVWKLAEWEGDDDSFA